MPTNGVGIYGTKCQEVDDVARNDAVFEDFLIGVDVAEKEVEGLDALLEALFNVGPIGVRNDAWNDVEGKNFSTPASLPYTLNVMPMFIKASSAA